MCIFLYNKNFYILGMCSRIQGKKRLMKRRLSVSVQFSEIILKNRVFDVYLLWDHTRGSTI